MKVIWVLIITKTIRPIKGYNKACVHVESKSLIENKAHVDKRLCKDECIRWFIKTLDETVDIQS